MCVIETRQGLALTAMLFQPAKVCPKRLLYSAVVCYVLSLKHENVSLYSEHSRNILYGGLFLRYGYTRHLWVLSLLCVRLTLAIALSRVL